VCTIRFGKAHDAAQRTAQCYLPIHVVGNASGDWCPNGDGLLDSMATDTPTAASKTLEHGSMEHIKRMMGPCRMRPASYLSSRSGIQKEASHKPELAIGSMHETASSSLSQINLLLSGPSERS
jgi:hypothetical protein